MKPLHPQVRIVTDGGRAGYYVEVCDGRAWRCETEALFRGVAEQRARWLSDVLEHALAVFNRGERPCTPRDVRDAILDEVIEYLEGCHIHETRGYYVNAVREMKGNRDE